jgi:UDP-glucose 4-epimerase
MVAATGPAERILGWSARRNLREMVESAWQGASAVGRRTSTVTSLDDRRAS